MSKGAFTVAICMIMLLCAVAGAAMSGCTGREKNTVYEAGNGPLIEPGPSETVTDADGNTVTVPSGGGTQSSVEVADKTNASSDSDSSDGTVSPGGTVSSGESSGEGSSVSDGTVIPIPTLPSVPGGISLPNLPTRPNGTVIPTSPNGTVIPTRPGGMIIPSRPSASNGENTNGSTEGYTKAPDGTDDSQIGNTEDKTGSGSVSVTVPNSTSGNENGNNNNNGNSNGNTGTGTPSNGGNTGTTTAPAETARPTSSGSSPVSGTTTIQSAPSAGFANIVVFVQTESTSSANYFADKTDGINKRWNTGERSLTSFLKKASNGKFTVNNIFPQYDSAKNIYVTYTVPDIPA